MADLNLSKFDLKGNLIYRWVPLLVGGFSASAGGIDTDKESFWIVHQDLTATTYILNYNKKGALIKSWTAASGKMFGVALQGKDLLTSESTGTNFALLNRPSMTTVKSSTVATYYGLSSNGSEILGAKVGASQVNFLESKTFSTKGSFATTNAPTGVCAVGDSVYTIESGIYLRSYGPRGGLRRSVNLPDITTNTYVDVCADEAFLWITSSSITDVDPV